MKTNFISVKKETPRLFANNILDALSRVHPVTPLILYLPVIAYLIYKSYITNISLVSGILLFLLGCFIWTINEYLLHRFVFHFISPNPFIQKLHFILHGVHHDYPNDPKRLVMPPSASIPLAILFYYFYSLFLKGNIFPFYAGFLIGYLAYDMSHYLIHHSNFKNSYFRLIKDRHMKHHYLDQKTQYGVTSSIWDNVFGTPGSINKTENQ
ncbi:MAG TPA: sterol desaturase family protein [Saprospiraceae bacterium]|nr:sterol desaturase family protein [Saprospiraceae bacterium]